jgi:endonuclease YncB( thermonuclease family)
MRYRALAVAALALLSLPAAAQTITDGDTIKLDGTRYRLWGIDAAESKQTCSDGWQAGTEATAFLRGLMAGHTIECERKTTDRYGRTVAICRADGQDLGAAMVRAGQAWAFVRYSSDYVPQERAAKGDELGVHAHDCLPAWRWRAAHHPQKQH